MVAVAMVFAIVGTASAAQATSQFSGTTSSTMTVNNGTSSGSIAAGTPFSGTLTYDDAQAPAPVAFGGGTHTVYSFSTMTLTIGTTTVSWGPGSIHVYDNLTSTSSGYPIGDSIYANINGVAPSGTINGAEFNWIFLGLVDYSGSAVSGGKMPAQLNLANFNSAFIEFNYGTLGTPWGAGNTSTLQFLSGLSGGSAPAPTPPTITTTSLPNGTVGVAYSAPISASAPNGDPLSLTVSGLPAGLSFDGANIVGAPSVPGIFTVAVTATDGATGLSATATLPLTVVDPAPVVCSGTDAVETAYVARNPGYIVVNGGLNLLDHLWTTNLDSTNTTFLGGLTNWYQAGLIVSYTGLADPAGCILDSLTVAPAVGIATSALPDGTVGLTYRAPIDAAWGVGPYALSVQGLPAGLAFDGASITGIPAAAGTYSVTVSVTDAVGATATAQLSLTINPGTPSGNYTVKDEGKGKITAVDPNGRWVMVGAKKLLVAPPTVIIVNTPDGTRNVIDSFVQPGMKVQWKGLRDKATNTVLLAKIEIN